MTLQFEDGRTFAHGACGYEARLGAPYDVYPRPFLTIRVEGHRFDAVLDTGGFFLILKPEVAEHINLQPADGALFEGMGIRGGSYDGHMHPVTLTLEGERGDTFDIEVTAFVPIDFPDRHPNFLGWPLCLERFRFALEPNPSDPTNGWFHFGPIDEG